MGVVLACDEEPEHAKLKYLFDVAPASACLTPELLRLVHFLKERTFCTYYEAVKAVIPYGAQYKPALAADGVTPVLQKQLTRHTENSYKLVGALQQKPRPTAKQLAAVALLSGGERTQNEMEAHGISQSRAGQPLRQGRRRMQQGEQIHRPVFVYPAEKRAHHPDGRAAGGL